jgi:hypothetical protein
MKKKNCFGTHPFPRYFQFGIAPAPSAQSVAFSNFGYAPRHTDLYCPALPVRRSCVYIPVVWQFITITWNNSAIISGCHISGYQQLQFFHESHSLLYPAAVALNLHAAHQYRILTRKLISNFLRIGLVRVKMRP